MKPEKKSKPDAPRSAPLIFPGRPEIVANAWFLGQRLDVKAFEKEQRLTTEAPYVIRAGEEGFAVLFRYGAIVLFGMSAEEEAEFLAQIRERVSAPFNNVETENARIIIAAPEESETVTPEFVRLRAWDFERIQLIADVLTKSSVLRYYETRIAETFDKIDPIAADLQRKGRSPSGRRGRDLLRHIGFTLSIQRKMVGHVEIEENPEILWEHPELERFYVRLEDEYEITERHASLLHKLDLIYRTAETMNHLLDQKRSLHVAWYIIVLIAIEILLMIVEKGHL